MPWYGPCRNCGHTIEKHSDGMGCKVCGNECGRATIPRKSDTAMPSLFSYPVSEAR